MFMFMLNAHKYAIQFSIACCQFKPTIRTEKEERKAEEERRKRELVEGGKKCDEVSLEITN